jgi:hypothetical protein
MRLNFSLLMNRFRDITVIDALNLLCHEFKATHAYIDIGASRKQLVDLYDEPEILMLRAADLELSFFGGPKTKTKWWTSNLLNMLLDHLLFAYSKKDMGPVHKALKVVV